MPTLSVSDLVLSFGDTPVLKGVEFEVSEGETVGIIGPNGSGKTTIFNCIGGFLLPKSGSFVFAGTDISKLPPHERAKLGLARVFQNFGVFKEMTVVENIITALESKQSGITFPWSSAYKNNYQHALTILADIKLQDKAKDKAGALSGGQMRLLEIARAMAFGASIFMLDEPTAGVSPKMKGHVQEQLVKLKKQGKTVLIIEHDMSFIQQLCDRILVINEGRVVLDGSPEEIRNDPQLAEIYFGKG